MNNISLRWGINMNKENKKCTEIENRVEGVEKQISVIENRVDGVEKQLKEIAPRKTNKSTSAGGFL